ncbi:MAG: Arc family DNA-binding protein [Gammaproteobacteria bacterium]|nr:Arc family DNA-binding protein [Gammaproteobacteria bacterium]
MMSTLVLRNVPDDLHHRLKEMAAAHRRSMNQEAIVLLKAALGEIPVAAPKPTWDEFAEQLRVLWEMPVLDPRTPDEIIGYDEYGLPR